MSIILDSAPLTNTPFDLLSRELSGELRAGVLIGEQVELGEADKKVVRDIGAECVRLKIELGEISLRQFELQKEHTELEQKKVALVNGYKERNFQLQQVAASLAASYNLPMNSETGKRNWDLDVSNGIFTKR